MRYGVAVTFTFDLQNLIRSSLGASEYSLSVSLRLPRPFMEYCNNDICPDEPTDRHKNRRTNVEGRQPQNRECLMMTAVTLQKNLCKKWPVCTPRQSDKATQQTGSRLIQIPRETSRLVWLLIKSTPCTHRVGYYTQSIHCIHRICIIQLHMCHNPASNTN